MAARTAIITDESYTREARQMISRIDHVSIAVRDYDRAAAFFKTLFGAVEGAGAEDPGMGFFWQLFSMGDLSRLELITPRGGKSYLDGFLKGREGGVHHITLETPDIEHVVRILDEHGVPHFGRHDYVGGVWKEVFIHPRDAFGVLIQIAEFRPDDWLGHGVKLPAGRRWEVRMADGACAIDIAHPGGGKVTIGLSREEARRFAEDIIAATG